MTDKFCPQCGVKADSAAKFCAECGTPIGAGTSKSGKLGTKGSTPSTGVRDLLIIVGVLAVVAVAYFMLADKPIPPAPQQQAAPSSTPQNMQDPHSDASISMGVLDSLPKDYNSLIQMAYHYHDEGSQSGNAQNFAIAAEIYRRALAIDSSDPNIRVDYGAVLHGMGLPQRSLEEFAKALKANPRHPVGTFNMGIVYHDIGNADSARIYFKRYLEIEPDGPAAESAKEFLKELGG